RGARPGVPKGRALQPPWTAVPVPHPPARAKLKPRAPPVLCEAAAGYPSNIEIAEALKPNVLVAHRHEDAPLARRNGAPVRALVPDRYFWKSAKWLTGIRFSAEDHPGYWEMRGYHNHADPWLEERYG